MKNRRTLLLVLLCCLMASCALADADDDAKTALEKKVNDFALLEGRRVILGQRVEELSFTLTEGIESKDWMPYPALYVVDEQGTWQYQYDVTFPSGASIRQMLVQDDTLYLVGSGATETDEFGNTYTIFSKGEVMKCRLEDGRLTTPESVQTFDCGSGSHGTFYAMGGDYLCVYFQNDFKRTSIYLLQLSTGQAKTMEFYETLYNLCAYKDGKVLLMTSDSDKQNVQCIMELNPATKATRTLFRLTTESSMNPFSLLSYDQERDAIYVADNSQLYLCKDGGSLQLCAYLPPNGYGLTCTTVIDHDTLLVNDFYSDAGIMEIPIQLSGTLATPLVIADSFASDLINRFALLHPEIPISMRTQRQTDTEVGQALVTGIGADIYRLRIDTSLYQSMIRKGYYVDLADFAPVRDFVDGMFPRFADMLMDGEHLCCMPIDIRCMYVTYYPDALEALNLVPDQLPHTFEELFEAISRWEDEMGDNDIGAVFAELTPNIGKDIMLKLVREQAMHCAQQQVPLTFDTPEFRHLLNCFVEKALPKIMRTEHQWIMMEPQLISLSELNEISNNYDYCGERNHYLLTYDSASPAYAATIMDVYLINPASTNIEAAKTFLAFVAEEMPLESRWKLLQNECVPRMSETALDAIETQELNIAVMEDSIAKEGDEYGWKEKNIAQMREDIEALHRDISFNWDVRPQHVKEWKEMAACAVPAPVIMDDIYSAIFELVKGQLSPDDFIREVERQVVMERMENE